MLGDIGSIMKLLGNRDKIQAEFGKFKDSLGGLTAEGDAGGGLVAVRVNGRMEVVSCRLREGAPFAGDPVALADLIVAATNVALVKARILVADEAQKVAQGLGIPPGLITEFGTMPSCG